jgi:methylated-DNA-[protein]-cysteine S-methyltransferase
MNQAYVHSPVGMWLIGEEGNSICQVDFVGDIEPPIGKPSSPLLEQAVEQLGDYFQGQRKTFSLPYHVKGTPFQEAVWRALCEIPYGKTCSYQDIAKKVGRPKAMRAVGGANHRNPISILIPCHRVIGQDGGLVGYGGGLEAKKFLLDLEGKFSDY